MNSNNFWTIKFPECKYKEIYKTLRKCLSDLGDLIFMIKFLLNNKWIGQILS